MAYKIIVVGIGPGSPDYLPPVAQRAIDQAKVLIGSQRALATFASSEAEMRVIDKHLDELMAFIRRCLTESDVVIMVSGDPGFYSLLARLRLEFSPEELAVIPGISSMQVAFARVGCPWQDATLVSLHGREAAEDQLIYQPNKKIGVLTDAQHDPRHIARLLMSNGWPPETATWLCRDLSYEDEQVLATTLVVAGEQQGYEHCVMVVTG
ncbi:MAG: precorrin-6y C5,15-methyltransferase (decarboxylating) subunit CbiE [Negativicutes bacterium]|nr:precorrin-6y C5,15-methyltransferase (decarboxylating) subunit CbiE [Negativicutes bacterium]